MVVPGTDKQKDGYQLVKKINLKKIKNKFVIEMGGDCYFDSIERIL